jgi:hypothetical protein
MAFLDLTIDCEGERRNKGKSGSLGKPKSVPGINLIVSQSTFHAKNIPLSPAVFSDPRAWPPAGARQETQTGKYLLCRRGGRTRRPRALPRATAPRLAPSTVDGKVFPRGQHLGAHLLAPWGLGKPRPGALGWRRVSGRYWPGAAVAFSPKKIAAFPMVVAGSNNDASLENLSPPKCVA